MLLALRSLWETTGAVIIQPAQLDGIHRKVPKRPRYVDEGYFVAIPPQDAIANARCSLTATLCESSAIAGPKELTVAVVAEMVPAVLSGTIELGEIHLLDEELVALLIAA